MSLQQVKIACLQYDHTMPLFEGAVKIVGVDAAFETATIPSDIFEKMIRDHAFDVAEMGLTYYLRTLDFDDPPFVALPIFLARAFRHASVYVNVHSGIQDPGDLAGKVIGEFGMYGHDAGIWSKGIFIDEYGWRPERSRWIIGASDWYMPPFDFIPRPHPAAVDVQPIPHGRTLSEMLDRGEVDAVISARAPRCFMEGSRNVARLFPDYAQVERDYYKRNAIFPIMHTLVVRKELISRQAEIATAIYKGFSQAKNLAMQRYKSGMVEQNIKSLVPWLTPLLVANSQMFPEDWWPYGIAANRLAIETFARYFFEQGLGKKLRSVDELFPAALSATDFPNS